jgi:hypothetical protein
MSTTFSLFVPKREEEKEKKEDEEKGTLRGVIICRPHQILLLG